MEPRHSENILAEMCYLYRRARLERDKAVMILSLKQSTPVSTNEYRLLNRQT